MQRQRCIFVRFHSLKGVPSNGPGPEIPEQPRVAQATQAATGPLPVGSLSPAPPGFPSPRIPLSRGRRPREGRSVAALRDTRRDSQSPSGTHRGNSRLCLGSPGGRSETRRNSRRASQRPQGLDGVLGCAPHTASAAPGPFALAAAYPRSTPTGDVRHEVACVFNVSFG